MTKVILALVSSLLVVSVVTQNTTAASGNSVCSQRSSSSSVSSGAATSTPAAPATILTTAYSSSSTSSTTTSQYPAAPPSSIANSSTRPSATSQARAPNPSGFPWSPRLNTPHWRGMNVINSNPSAGTPGVMNDQKNMQNWNDALYAIKKMRLDFNTVRIYSVTEKTDLPAEQHLELVMPSVINYDMRIFVGVVSEGDNGTARYEAEKRALQRTLGTYGCSYFAAVNVGDKDIWYNRSDTTMARVPLTNIDLLVNQVKEVREILQNYGCSSVPVTHTEPDFIWFQDNTSPLISAVDFVTANIYPYWEGVTIDTANATFWQHLTQVQNRTNQFGKEVWIGETGWPWGGPTHINATASIYNAQRYWNETWLPAMHTLNSFYFAEWDRRSADAGTPAGFGLWNYTSGLPLITTWP